MKSYTLEPATMRRLGLDGRKPPVVRAESVSEARKALRRLLAVKGLPPGAKVVEVNS